MRLIEQLQRVIRRFRNRNFERAHLANLAALDKDEALLNSFIGLLKQQAAKLIPNDDGTNRFFNAMFYIINPIRQILFQKSDRPKVLTLEYLKCEDSVEFSNFPISYRNPETQVLSNLEAHMNYITQGPPDDDDYDPPDFDDDMNDYYDHDPNQDDYHDDID